MDTFDMDSTFKTENYSKNKATLLFLMTRLGIAPPAPTSKPVQTIPQPSTSNATGTNSTTTSKNKRKADSRGKGFLIWIIVAILVWAIWYLLSKE